MQYSNKNCSYRQKLSHFNNTLKKSISWQRFGKCWCFILHSLDEPECFFSIALSIFCYFSFLIQDFFFFYSFIKSSIQCFSKYFIREKVNIEFCFMQNANKFKLKMYFQQPKSVIKNKQSETETKMWKNINTNEKKNIEKNIYKKGQWQRQKFSGKEKCTKRRKLFYGFCFLSILSRSLVVLGFFYFFLLFFSLSLSRSFSTQSIYNGIQIKCSTTIICTRYKNSATTPPPPICNVREKKKSHTHT